MYHFEYVTKNERKKEKAKLIQLLNLVQDEVRKKFTFRFDFVGSDKRNMVTCDRKSNIGYDFDVNIEVNDDDENYSPKMIKTILIKAFNKYANKFNYSQCENNTRVITIKVVDNDQSKIKHSCDFAIVNNCKNGQQQYIRFNKNRNSYSWDYQGKGFYQLPEKIRFCKDNKLWNEVKEMYLYKKNTSKDLNKKSRSIFAETINQICDKYKYSPF